MAVEVYRIEVNVMRGALMEDISDRVLDYCDQLRPTSASFGGICIKRAPASMSTLGSGLHWHQLAPRTSGFGSFCCGSPEALEHSHPVA